MVVPSEGLVRGQVAVPVGEVEEAEGEREEDAGGGVDPGGAVRRALPRRLDLPLPTVALMVRNEVLLTSKHMLSRLAVCRSSTLRARTQILGLT